MDSQFKRWFSRGLAQAATTAIVHTPTLTAAAVVDASPGVRPRLLHAGTHPHPAGSNQARATQSWLRALPHRETRVCAVLPPGQYQLFQLDAARVPDSELREAMRWELRDLISVPPERLAIDVFPTPPRPNASGAPQVYVVAAEQSQVEAQAELVQAAARRLEAVDIPELALRNLMRRVPGESQGCAMLMLARGYVQILVSRQGRLYVMRRVDGAVAHDPEHIALEVQRSLQYYETHFDSAPIAQLLIAPAGRQADELAPALAASTGLQVRPLPLAELLTLEAAPTELEQPELLLAIGAALRPMHAEALQ